MPHRVPVARAPRRYRIDFVELKGATYPVRVSSRDEALERIAEAFAANPDIVYADLFTPAGDWSERVPSSPAPGGLVAAPATDLRTRRRRP